MKTHIFYLTAIVSLSSALAFYVTQYSDSKSKQQDLEALLFRAAYSIDRDNQHIHDDMETIFSYKNYNKTEPWLTETQLYFDSLNTTLATKDSASLVNSIYHKVQAKLKFNDTLREFRNRFTNHAIYNNSYFMIERLEHNTEYHNGDTARLITGIINTTGLIDDPFEIIDFSPKETGKQTGNYIEFAIPIGKVNKSVSDTVTYNFEYEYMMRNKYTNEKTPHHGTKTLKILTR